MSLPLNLLHLSSQENCEIQSYIETSYIFIDYLMPNCGVCGVMVSVIGNGHSDPSSNLDEAVCFSHNANSNVGNCSRRQPEGSLFDSYYTEV